MKPLEMNLIDRVQSVNYQRQKSLNQSREVASNKSELNISSEDYSRLLNQTRDEEMPEEMKMGKQEKIDMQIRRDKWI